MLLRRMDGVLRVKASKLVMFQSRRLVLPELMKLLPDADLPTVMSLEGRSEEVGVQVLCRSAITWQRLEEMKLAGASNLLVLPVDQMLS
jgi:ATP phosphoribosyltransferase